jgi:hypothetical protein
MMSGGKFSASLVSYRGYAVRRFPLLYAVELPTNRSLGMHCFAAVVYAERYTEVNIRSLGRPGDS